MASLQPVFGQDLAGALHLNLSKSRSALAARGAGSLRIARDSALPLPCGRGGANGLHAVWALQAHRDVHHETPPFDHSRPYSLANLPNSQMQKYQKK